MEKNSNPPAKGQHAQKRMLAMAALGFVPDLIVALIILAFVAHKTFATFVEIFIGLQAVYLLVWVKNSIWGWLTFRWFTRKTICQAVLQLLCTKSFPLPGPGPATAGEYFARIANDPAQPLDVRFSAVAESSALNSAAAQGHVQEAMKMALAYDEALALYQKRCTETRLTESAHA